jgi:hypothetical protein
MVSNVHHQLGEHRTPALPLHKVDALAFLPGWRERPSYLDDLVRPAHQNAWVLDSWGDAPVRDLQCSRADTVVWLDYRPHADHPLWSTWRGYRPRRAP